MKIIPRNLELDRLRAVAALLTLCVHLHQVFYPWTFTMHYKPPQSVVDLLGNAWAGVDLFFVISGFIISRTLIEGIDMRRARPGALVIYVKTFYLRRLFRIMPIAWIVVAIVISCGLFLNDGGYFASAVYNTQAAVAILTQTFNFWLPAHKIEQGVPLAQYWSLSVEEQFYLLFPLFLILARTMRQRVLCAVAMLVLITFFLRPFAIRDPVQTFFYTQTRCDGLLYGFLLYAASTQPWFRALRITPGRWRHAGGVVVVVLALALGAVTSLDFGNTILVPVVCVISTLMVFLAVCESGLVCFPQPFQALLDYVGKRSYTLYLVHLPMFYLTTELMFRYTREHSIPITQALWPQYTLVMITLVIVSTELLHRLVEVPMIERGRKHSESIMCGENVEHTTPPAQVASQSR
jgi:peptidoglycan/LPS O-acetylase OafA/YrhL